MKRLLRITVLFSVTLLWWGEKGYAATPAMDAAEKETVSATVEAEADKKDPKSDKKSDEPKRKRNLGHLSGSFETNTIYYVEDSKTGAVVPHNSYGSNNFLKLDYQLGRFSAGVQLEYYPHPLVGIRCFLPTCVVDEVHGDMVRALCAGATVFRAIETGRIRTFPGCRRTPRGPIDCPGRERTRCEVGVSVCADLEL